MVDREHWLHERVVLTFMRNSRFDKTLVHTASIDQNQLRVFGTHFALERYALSDYDPQCAVARLRHTGPPEAREYAPEMTNDEFRIAMILLDQTLDGMATMLGIGRRQIAHYRKDKAIPPHIAMSVRYLLPMAQ